MKLILLQPTLKAFDDRYNPDAIEALIRKFQSRIHQDDLLVLPEHFTSDSSAERYEEYTAHLASIAHCTIIGGSHHRKIGTAYQNVGNAIDREGNIIGNYSKLRPYFEEQKRVSPGQYFGQFTLNNINIIVMICADFWYSDLLLSIGRQPDIVIIPALSVSRKSTPDFSKAQWKHLAIARAYEFGMYVGISDWSAASQLPKYRTCGVGGFADPTQTEPDLFYQPISEEGFSAFEIDMDALHAFRDDRKMRGFFWKE